ncbi:RNA polymerase sigma factor SigJ [Streptomyces cavernicola]|uniref:RNA polymerase sigma factor SigJ n=1 Tax=Streptomyces cavernicola TaxID=3043613 RepID=A0ABT6S6S8_9ACTN|nr:RNA polymerase sigma factor SigJ [Streptomyces sp. B-S-A6]MDI3403747.1 RNA polymerase sigma factor SigJ [Streptomyces sp. B-S-A6]
MDGEQEHGEDGFASGREPEPGVSVIMGERRQLLNLAYRLLGSLADAEDVVQEAYTRWYAMDLDRRQAVDSPGAWLCKVAGRICLDQLRSARARRESYVGAWLPEPVPDRSEWPAGRIGDRTADPADRVTLDESVNMAFLVVLDAMTPAERVAFVLHDVFRYSFAEVAEIVGRTPAACRKLASSARSRLRASRPAPQQKAERADVVREFKRAWEAKDVSALVGVLDPAVTGLADGGGLVRARLHPMRGAVEIAEYLTAVSAGAVDRTVLERTVNGEPGLVVQDGGVTTVVMSFEIEDGRITRLWAVRNPEKLRSWTATD